MKKVFRIWKFVESARQHGNLDGALESLRLGWPQMFDGKTEEQMNKKGYVCNYSWLVVE